MVRSGRVGVRRFLIGGVSVFVLMAASVAVAADSGWAIQKTPNPAGAAERDLFGVSCTSVSACTAVGEHASSGGEFMTLAERHS